MRRGIVVEGLNVCGESVKESHESEFDYWESARINMTSKINTPVLESFYKNHKSRYIII